MQKVRAQAVHPFLKPEFPVSAAIRRSRLHPFHPAPVLRLGGFHFAHGHELRPVRRFYLCAGMDRIEPREFRAKEKDLRGVIHPHQADHQRPGGAIGRGKCAPAQIQSQRILSEREQHGRDDRAQPHIAPGYLHIRQQFEDEREQQRNCPKRQHKIHGPQDHFLRGDHAAD